MLEPLGGIPSLDLIRDIIYLLPPYVADVETDLRYVAANKM
jgi:hypothetical protein